MENQHGTRGVLYFRFTLFSYQLHSTVMKVPSFYGTPAFIIVPHDTDTSPHTKPVTSKPQLLFLFDSISVIPHLHLRGIPTGLLCSDFALKIALLHPAGLEHQNDTKLFIQMVKLLSHIIDILYTQFMCNPRVKRPVCEADQSGRLAPSLTLRRLMSYIYIYIYGAPILDVSRSHTTTQHSR